MMLARRIVLRSAVAFAGLAILATLALADPAVVGWYPPCIFHRLTGLNCPGCGSSRGLHSLMHGEIGRAADYNLLLLPALPVIAVGLFHKLTGGGDRLWQALNKPRLILLIICVFWILRNIPRQPLSWLNAAW